jgi:hypothetical protein
MRRMVYSLALALMVPALAAAQTSFPEVTNGKWKGVVVEQSCYRQLGADKATAAAHNACAMDCLKKGQPLALVTDDDGVRKIIGNMSNDNYTKMTQWIGKRVAVTGNSSKDAFSSLYIDITTIAATK